MGRKRKIWSAVMALLMTIVLLTGCGEGVQSVVNMVASQMGGFQKVNQTISDESKWVNSSIDGSIDATLQIAEKDDFYTAVNKDWILTAEVNEDTPNVGALIDNADVVEERIDEIIQNCMTSEQMSGENGVGMPEKQYQHTQELVSQFARLLADVDGRDAQGIEPARAYIESIENIQTLSQMTEYMENKDGTNFAMLNLIPVSMEIPRSTRDGYAVYVGQTPSFLLMKAESYSAIDTKNTLLKEVIVDSVEPMLVQLGYTQQESAKMVRNCFNIEGMLAENMSKAEEGVESLEAYKKLDHFYTYEELQKMQGDYPLTEMLACWGLDKSEVFNIENEDYVKYVGRLYKEKNLRKIKDYMIVNTLVKMLPYMDKTSYETFDMMLKIQSGNTTTIEEEERVKTFINYQLSEALQEIYIGQYCDAGQKEELIALIEDSIGYYRKMIQQEEWLTEETRNMAIEKLDNLCYRVLYPNQLTDYSTLVFSENDTLLDMLAKVGQFNNAQMKNKVNKEIDRYDWNLAQMSTLDVNAYYMPMDNSINILAGILANGFVYDKDAPDEMNLARIGTIVGHEITHGFDTSGYAFDKDGIPNKWWTYEDEEQFQIRASHLAKYFSALSPFRDGGAYDGDTVKGEAIADMGGVKCMLGIAKEKENFDYNLFFTSYAQLWRSKNTVGYELLILGDEHPLDCFRVNVTLQQFDEFIKTYDIQPGDGMYLSPEKRIAVW